MRNIQLIFRSFPNAKFPLIHCTEFSLPGGMSCTTHLKVTSSPSRTSVSTGFITMTGSDKVKPVEVCLLVSIAFT